MPKTAIHTIRYGGEGLITVRKVLQAGPLTAELLDDGSLRYIKHGDQEIVRSLHATFRDHNWSTIPAQIQSLHIEEADQSFIITYTAKHRNAQVDYVWDGRIEGKKDGTIKYTMDGEARNDFLRNRIGFCLLQPMELADAAVAVHTPSGTLSGTFSKLITPHDPFLNIQSMQYSIAPHTEIEMTFEGDLFQTEDQRNWTDASYKTFCTPLELPYPVKVSRGERIQQSVTLQVHGTHPITATESVARTSKLTVESRTAGRLPDIGTLFAPLNRLLSGHELDLLHKLSLAHFRVVVNLLATDWQQQLQYASIAVEALAIGLEIEVLSDQDGSRIPALLSFIKENQIAVTRLSLYPESGFDPMINIRTKFELSGASLNACQYTTNASLLKHTRERLLQAGLTIPLGGGSRGNFAEFNRTILPLDHMDYAEYAINPQVHAADIASIIETLDVQALTLKTAQSYTAALPLRINSVTLKARINPYALDAEGARQSEARSEQVDSRLQSLFAAGWTIGSIRQLATAGAVSVNYYENVGILGIMEEEGQALHPIYQVLADIGEFAGGELCAIQLSDSKKFEAVALRQDSQLRLLVANLTNELQEIEIEAHNLSSASARMIDETNVAQYLTSRDALLRSSIPLEFHSGHVRLTALPYAVVCIDATVEDK